MATVGRSSCVPSPNVRSGAAASPDLVEHGPTTPSSSPAAKHRNSPSTLSLVNTVNAMRKRTTTPTYAARTDGQVDEVDLRVGYCGLSVGTAGQAQRPLEQDIAALHLEVHDSRTNRGEEAKRNQTAVAVETRGRLLTRRWSVEDCHVDHTPEESHHLQRPCGAAHGLLLIVSLRVVAMRRPRDTSRTFEDSSNATLSTSGSTTAARGSSRCVVSCSDGRAEVVGRPAR